MSTTNKVNHHIFINMADTSAVLQINSAFRKGSRSKPRRGDPHQSSSTDLQVTVDEVEQEDSRHAHQELRGRVEAAQVNAQHAQLIHRADVRRHHLRGGGDRDGDVLPRAVVTQQGELATHLVSGLRREVDVEPVIRMLCVCYHAGNSQLSGCYVSVTLQVT